MPYRFHWLFYFGLLFCLTGSVSAFVSGLLEKRAPEKFFHESDYVGSDGLYNPSFIPDERGYAYETASGSNFVNFVDPTGREYQPGDPIGKAPLTYERLTETQSYLNMVRDLEIASGLATKELIYSGKWSNSYRYNTSVDAELSEVNNAVKFIEKGTSGYRWAFKTREFLKNFGLYSDTEYVDITLDRWDLNRPADARALAAGNGFNSTKTDLIFDAAGFSVAKLAAINRVAKGSGSWLQYWEGIGRRRSLGHTLKLHVGQSDADLIARLGSNPRLRSASTFTNQATAESVIGKTISANRNKLNIWVRNANPGDRLRLNYRGSDVIGRGATRGVGVGDRTNARVILQMRDNGKYHILTAFPE